MSFNPQRPLAQKIALVTGGSSGIGLAISQRLASAGAHVMIVASHDHDKAEAAAALIRAGGDCASAYVADVRSAADVARLVEDVTAWHGPIDILINSAGVWYPSPITALTEESITRMLDINLTGVIRTVAAVAPGMIERKSGRIVNLASIAGLVPSPGYSLYATAKAGVIAFTRAAALDLAPHNVAINAISPGNTATPINEEIRTSPAMQARRDWISRITPSPRLFTPPEEIAEAALFLVDGRVSGMYGSVIAIDEGRSAGLTARWD